MRLSDSRQIEDATLCAALAGFVLSQDIDQILNERRGSDATAWSRQVAMYLMYVTSGLSLAKVAHAFGRDRSTVAHACHQVEDRRDDPDFDAWIEGLEQALELMFGLRERVVPSEGVQA